MGIGLGVDTGISQVDVLRATMRSARENYDEFLSWGFTKGWRALPGFSDDVGYVWGPWYVANGKTAFLTLVREAMPAHSPEENAFVELSRAVEQAAGKPIADQLAAFAGSGITGYGRAWSTWFGTTPLDWGSLFERWTPAPLAPGGSTTRALGAGGMMGHEITTDARVSISGSADTRLYLVRDVATRVKVRAVSGSSVAVDAPPAGERIYALAVRPVAGSEIVTLAVDPPGPKPKETETVAGPAQAPVRGTVITSAAGAGERIGGVTSGYVVFEVPEGVDNASGEAVASYPLPADIDLFLQLRGPDGRWTDVTSGESGSLTGESMTFGRLGPGTYRIEVHNWLGPPGNLVSVTATFFNSAGVPGA